MTSDEFEAIVRQECTLFTVNLDWITFDDSEVRLQLSCERGTREYIATQWRDVNAEATRAIIHNTVAYWI